MGFPMLVIIIVDVVVQGLTVPIIKALITDPTSTLMPADRSMDVRNGTCVQVIGVFDLFWIHLCAAPFIPAGWKRQSHPADGRAWPVQLQRDRPGEWLPRFACVP